MKIAEFGNTILRQKARKLTVAEIKSPKTRKIIKEMQQFLISKKMGVGLAAPQVGEDMALAVISIRPKKNREEAEEFDLVIINPEITEVHGRRKQEWEGCISGGALKSGLFAKVPRYKKVKLKYRDEKGKLHHKTFEGLPAHVIQHEVDHLEGILFVDKVKDTKTFITYGEYMKLAKALKEKSI
ncbi:MAG TPA: peptide deformylase [Candidatus Saccharimonadales bacterium]|nr:peptide deformylase [Candidatus Saccharimonadales bacterium]